MTEIWVVCETCFGYGKQTWFFAAGQEIFRLCDVCNGRGMLFVGNNCDLKNDKDSDSCPS
jgi:DnaJ-class molecular chaperone